MNLGYQLMAALEARPSCSAFNQSLRVYAPNTANYFHPDVSVVCGDPLYRDARGDILTNPRVIFEVLSSSTEGRDRGVKFHGYKLIETLHEYVLVSQHVAKVEVLRRAENGFWVYADFAGLDSVLSLTSLDITIPLDGIYRGVRSILSPSSISATMVRACLMDSRGTRRKATCRGKSGLHWATCRLTAGGVCSKRISRIAPQKMYRQRQRW